MSIAKVDIDLNTLAITTGLLNPRTPFVLQTQKQIHQPHMRGNNKFTRNYDGVQGNDVIYKTVIYKTVREGMADLPIGSTFRTIRGGTFKIIAEQRYVNISSDYKPIKLKDKATVVDSSEDSEVQYGSSDSDDGGWGGGDTEADAADAADSKEVFVSSLYSLASVKDLEVQWEDVNGLTWLPATVHVTRLEPHSAVICYGTCSIYLVFFFSN